MNDSWKVGIVFDTAKKSKGHHGLPFAFNGLLGMEPVLADSNSNPCEDFLKASGARKHYTDYREMIKKEKPDIIAVCSRWPDDHYEIIKTAVENGSHIICEKPLTASLEEADKMIALAEDKNIRIAVAHLARYALVFRTLKKMIQNGDIGQPLTFYGRGKEDERGGGEDMMVLGTHILDLGVFLFGKPESIFADVQFEGRPITEKDRIITTEPIGLCAGDSVFAHIKFPNGINGIFESRKGLFEKTVRMGVSVVGTKGTLSVRYDQERKLRISRSQLPPEDEAQYEEVELLEDRIIPEGAEPIDYEIYGPKPAQYFADNNRFAVLDLIESIREERQPVSSAYDARTSLEMIYAVYASALTGKAIRFPFENRNHPLGE